MSIINDALKKVQTDIEKKWPRSIMTGSSKARQPNSGKKAAKISSPSQEVSPPDYRPTTKTFSLTPRKRPHIGLIIALVVTCGLALFSVINQTALTFSPTPSISLPPLDMDQPPSPYEITISNPVPFPDPSAPLKSLSQAIPEGITIGGIVDMGDKNVALINDKIYEIGDTVDGMKIINISLDSVQMINKGETETFMVKKSE